MLRAWFGSLPRIDLECVYYRVVAPATIALVFLVMPLRGYDEPMHLYRTEALSHGLVLPVVVEEANGEAGAGGTVDRTLRGWSLRFPLFILPVLPISARQVWSGMFVHSDDARVEVGYSNTALYPPLLYLPSVAGIVATKLVGLPVAAWFYAARLANALTAIAIIGGLMRTMPTLRPVILVFASLPIVLFQSAMITADSVLLPVALAFACLLSRLFGEDSKRRATTLALAATTVVLCVGKIAFLPFAILPPLAARAADGSWSRRATMLAATSLLSVILWAGWSWIIHDKIFSVRPGVTIDPFAQLRWLAANPSGALQVLGHTATLYAPSVVPSAVGWKIGGLRLWDPTIALGAVVMLAAAFRQKAATPPPWFVALAATLAVGIGLGVVLLLYLQFNAVANDVVLGVQGRYFLPSAMLVVVFCPFGLGERYGRLFVRLAAVFAISSVVTILLATSDYWKA